MTVDLVFVWVLISDFPVNDIKIKISLLLSIEIVKNWEISIAGWGGRGCQMDYVIVFWQLPWLVNDLYVIVSLSIRIQTFKWTEFYY